LINTVPLSWMTFYLPGGYDDLCGRHVTDWKKLGIGLARGHA
jgi:hypothetical protein